MNTHSKISRISAIVAVAVLLAGLFSAGFTTPASADHITWEAGYSDGKGCTWWHVVDWIGACNVAYDNTTGWIYFYFGGLENPWIVAGHYDANYSYFYDFQGWYLSRTEHATGLVTYPSDCGWITSGQTCLTGNTLTQTWFTMHGSNLPNDAGTQILLEANNDIIDTWTAPNCNPIYYDC